jgi:hypothetical protein
MNHCIMDGLVHRLKRLVPLMVLMVAACNDPYGPALWDATPDTLLVYSASRAEYLGQASAVDIGFQSGPAAFPLESPGVTGSWDFALTDIDGGLALTPASAFEGLDSRARIGVLPDRDLDDVVRAPSDTVFKADPVLVEAGNVYAVRSRRVSCSGVSGYLYGKLRAVAIDETAGTLRFEIVVNPYCDRSFVPPEE